MEDWEEYRKEKGRKGEGRKVEGGKDEGRKVEGGKVEGGKVEGGKIEEREDTWVLPYGISDGEEWRVDTRVDPAIPRIIQWYKTMSTNEYLRKQKALGITDSGKLWQRSYYDHIIRTSADYYRISTYIRNNPAQWIADRFHQ